MTDFRFQEVGLADKVVGLGAIPNSYRRYRYEPTRVAQEVMGFFRDAVAGKEIVTLQTLTVFIYDWRALGMVSPFRREDRDYVNWVSPEPKDPWYRVAAGRLPVKAHVVGVMKTKYGYQPWVFFGRNHGELDRAFRTDLARLCHNQELRLAPLDPHNYRLMWSTLRPRGPVGGTSKEYQLMVEALCDYALKGGKE